MCPDKNGAKSHDVTYHFGYKLCIKMSESHLAAHKDISSNLVMAHLLFSRNTYSVHLTGLTKTDAIIKFGVLWCWNNQMSPKTSKLILLTLCQQL